MFRNKTLWDYFEKGDKGENAKCLLCSAILKISQRSTKGLIIHLKSKHCVNLKSTTLQQPRASTSKEHQAVEPATQAIIDCQDQDAEVIPKKKAKTIDTYFVKEITMEKMVSRMIAKDGFTFNSFCTSSDLRYLFSKSNFKLPTSPNTIRSMVIKYSDSVKADMVNELERLIKQNQKFSLTFDEWTSQNNTRYINLNVHIEAKHFNLGLIRINGSCTAESCVELVEERLKSFDINLQKDVIGMTTDGASVMKKVGRLMPCYQQLCYAHGIQLAVIDTLYKKKHNEEVEELLTAYGSENHEDHENINSDDDEPLNSEDYGLTVTLDQPLAELVPNYTELIKKVRNVVKIFKNSPTKNDTYLQKYVREEHNKNLKLILDCQTRWNSLLNMIERFYCLRLCITKALIDIASEIRFTDQEWSQINTLKLCLEPLKLGVEVLCRRESNLLTAETTFRFMLEKLDKQSSALSFDLATALRARLMQRRTCITSLLIYLQNYAKYEQDIKMTSNTFLMPKKSVMREEIKKILERVFKIEENCESDHEDFSENSQQTLNLSLKEELEIQILKEKKDCTKKIKNVPDIPYYDYDKILKKEMSVYESDAVRGKFLSMIYEYLKTISPTSVEAERAFSAAGYICSSLRSRLGDETLNSVCFLRSHFQQ